MFNRATQAQIEYIKILCERLGYDCEDYLSEELTKQEAARIINDLKDEWEG
ncbi:DUF3072 domain-containing protein [Thermosinus carboxydivorans]|uniref:DUF3072 domain-containing protein n=1 Tax=Thermosinus carboxydivorans TaxID=261685 RepID=UPI0002EAF254|nr:DUF3072 domain-containing protein [Thermosinus carboxydivorans]